MSDNKLFGISEQLDTISRAEAIKSVCKMLSNCFNASEEMIESVKITVGEMPSAQRWIPCSECKKRCEKWEHLKT